MVIPHFSGIFWLDIVVLIHEADDLIFYLLSRRVDINLDFSKLIKLGLIILKNLIIFIVVLQLLCHCERFGVHQV